jgi:hypothetical protein
MPKFKRWHTTRLATNFVGRKESTAKTAKIVRLQPKRQPADQNFSLGLNSFDPPSQILEILNIRIGILSIDSYKK